MPAKIFGYTLLCLSALTAAPAAAQQDTARTEKPVSIRGVQYSSADADAASQNAPSLFAGCAVSGNLMGLFLTAFTSYGEIEGAVRLNLRERYFPVAEAGVGVCDKDDDATGVRFKTHAPYARLGCDYNFLNNPNGNRVFGGMRVAFTSFKYDISGPDFEDPIWGGVTPNNFKDIKGNQTWLELVFGVEAKIWSIFHLGWSLRYKNRLSHSAGDIGEPWYVPGYGKGGSSVIGGTFNLVFDI